MSSTNAEKTSSSPEPADLSESEGEYPFISDTQKKAMLGLESLKNSRLEDTETDRLTRANSEAARQPSPDENRERRVVFKDDPVDFEVPPDDYPSEATSPEPASEASELNESSPRQSMDQKRSNESRSERTREDDSNDQENKVLVEKEGKFELLDADHWKRTQQVDEPQKEPKKSRPLSAPTKQRNPVLYHEKRPQSAKFDKMKYRGRRTPEQIEEARREAIEKKKQEKIERDQKMKEEMEKERVNKEAFEAWCKSKKEEDRKKQQSDRQKIKQEEEKQEELKKSMKEKNLSFEQWEEMKREQKRHEQLLDQLKANQEAANLYTRTQDECEKAFKEWLKAKRQKENEVASKAKQKSKHRSISAKKSKKSSQIATAIKLAQQFRYVDYYGYRS